MVTGRETERAGLREELREGDRENDGHTPRHTHAPSRLSSCCWLSCHGEASQLDTPIRRELVWKWCVCVRESVCMCMCVTFFACLCVCLCLLCIFVCVCVQMVLTSRPSLSEQSKWNDYSNDRHTHLSPTCPIMPCHAFRHSHHSSMSSTWQHPAHTGINRLGLFPAFSTQSDDTATPLSVHHRDADRCCRECLYYTPIVLNECC